MCTLHATCPSFIRCIIPNERKEPGLPAERETNPSQLLTDVISSSVLPNPEFFFSEYPNWIGVFSAKCRDIYSCYFVSANTDLEFEPRSERNVNDISDFHFIFVYSSYYPKKKTGSQKTRPLRMLFT